MGKIRIFNGDITILQVDAIVNAANETLLGGGGVDGAIHRAAGPYLLEECEKLNGCKTGEAKVTKGYQLQAKNIIHTVGPIWKGGFSNEDQLLKNCYLNSLKIASELGLKSIAFPAISTGVYKFPFTLATEIAIDTVFNYTLNNELPELIIFVLFSQSDYEYYKQELLIKKII